MLERTIPFYPEREAARCQRLRAGSSDISKLSLTEEVLKSFNAHQNPIQPVKISCSVASTLQNIRFSRFLNVKEMGIYIDVKTLWSLLNPMVDSAMRTGVRFRKAVTVRYN